VEWQQAFRNLNIRGQEFLELAHNDGLVNHVLPEVMRISPNANEQWEHQQALRIKGYLSEILDMTQDDKPATGTLTRAQANRRISGQRSSTLPSYAENGYKGSSDNLHRIPTSEQSARSRNEYSKGALASVEPIRHSPSSSETNFPHGFGGLSASPHGSPNLGHRDISTRHGKSNSTESVASSTLSHRAGDGKGDQKALKILGIVTRSDKDATHERVAVRQDSYDKHPSGGGKIVNKIRKKFFPKDGEVEEESPTSPSWRGGYAAQSPFAVDRNESSSSLDRVSISSFDGARKPLAYPGPTGARNKLYVFVTRDTRMFVLCDLTGLEKIEDVRKRICLDVGIPDYHTADICLTEAGQKDHGTF
jgi:mitogen-activated protein kinase kinase kinase